MNGYETQRLAVALLREHGLDRTSPPWRVKLDTAKRRFGRCEYSPRIIRISAVMAAVNDDAAVRDTILHEIAHALTPGAGHGPRWKARCLEIGAIPSQYCGANVRTPDKPWALACPVEGCSTRHERFRRTSPRRGFWACRVHSVALVWIRNTP